MPSLNLNTHEPDQETEYEEPVTQEKVETNVNTPQGKSTESVSALQTPILIQQTQKSTKEKIRALYEQLLSKLMWKTVVVKGEGSTAYRTAPDKLVLKPTVFLKLSKNKKLLMGLALAAGLAVQPTVKAAKYLYQESHASKETQPTEICDGIDNDNNGMIDEPFGVGNPCTVGVGACRNTGIILCNAQRTASCSAKAGTPTAEIYDNIDNDCNGQTDDVAAYNARH